MEEDILEIYEVSVFKIFQPLFILLVATVVAGLFLVTLDSTARQQNQFLLQKGLSKALTAYLTEYELDTGNLEQISEGYLLHEDLATYNKESNSLYLNEMTGSKYFFNILESNVNMPTGVIKTAGVYIVNISTNFKQDGSATYNVKIWRNGNDLMRVSPELNSLESVEKFVEDALLVKIDIATGYNASIRTFQTYQKETGYTGSGETTFSSYNTAMAILTNIPVKGIFGEIPQNVYELQTYSLTREGAE